MLSSIQPSASHSSPPPPLGLTNRSLPNEAIFPPNPNKLQPLIPSWDEAATSQPDAPALRSFSLRPLPLGETHSCAAFPTAANSVERLTKRSHFSFQPEQTETTCTIPSRSQLPRGPFPAAGPPKPMNGNIKENPHAPHRSLGSPRKPAKSVRSSARPDAGWKAVPRGDPSQEWLRYRAISATHVMRER